MQAPDYPPKYNVGDHVTRLWNKWHRDGTVINVLAGEDWYGLPTWEYIVRLKRRGYEDKRCADKAEIVWARQLRLVSRAMNLSEEL